MKGIVRQAAVLVARNVRSGKVKIIGAAGSEGKLLFIPNGKIDIFKGTCIVGLFIPVILFAEHFEGIAARRKTGGDRYPCRTGSAATYNPPIVKGRAAFVREHCGNIFVRTCWCAGIVDAYRPIGISRFLH